MSLSSVRQALAALFVAVLVSACGGSGSSAPAPVGGITVKPGDGTATVTWTMDPNVKYWVFYAPSTSISTSDWTTKLGSVAVMNVTSPYVVSGLANGYTYSFTVNGRTGDGPGGPGSPSVSIVPRPAGETWSAPVALGSNTLRSITYGTSSADSLGYYLAVGDAGAAFKSTTGLGFSAVAMPSTAPLHAVTYTLSKFIAVGAGGTIVYSPDLATWVTTPSGSTQNLNAVASNGALAVAVGNAGTALRSADGITWTAITLPTTQNLYGISYSTAGVWTAVGAGGTLLSSADGLTWVAVASGTTADLYAVAVQVYTSYTYVAVGANGTIIRSTDGGATWAAQTSPTTANLLAVSPTTSQFLATGVDGTVLTSPTGVTWTRRTSSTSASLNGVIGGLAQYVAVGQGGITVNSQ